MAGPFCRADAGSFVGSMLSMSLAALGCLLVSAGLALWAMPRLLQHLLDRWPGRPEFLDSRKRIVQRLSRATAPVVLVVSICVASVLRFGDPVSLLRVVFSRPAPWLAMAGVASVVIAGIAVVAGVGLVSGSFVVRDLGSLAGLGPKLAGIALTAPALAVVEDTFFCVVVLDTLVARLGPSSVGISAAIAVHVALFAGAHRWRQLRRRRPIVQSVVGHSAFALTLATAYLADGLRLWLPSTIHAAAIVAVQISRATLRNQGPHRLWVGTRSEPHSGLIGLAALAVLVLWLAQR